LASARVVPACPKRFPANLAKSAGRGAFREIKLSIADSGGTKKQKSRTAGRFSIV
jgi:hypothetical protein